MRRLLTLSVALLTTSTLAGPVAPAGDIVMRQYIQVLAYYGAITNPTMAWPMALDTNGIVRDARGLTSSTNRRSSLIAYWTFISPHTLSFSARACVQRRISACTSTSSVGAGMTQADQNLAAAEPPGLEVGETEEWGTASGSRTRV